MKKITIAIVSIFIIFGFVATPLKATTLADLQAMIKSLTDQLNALSSQQTPPTSPGVSISPSIFTRDLTVGMRGADVLALQNFLIERGYSIPRGANGYFGPVTKSALTAYQVNKGIIPADGFFGAVTRASINSFTSPIATLDGPITLNRSLDAQNNEVILNGVATVNIEAPQNKDILVDQIVLELKDSNGNMVIVNNPSRSMTGYANTNKERISVNGGFYDVWRVRAGQTGKFTVERTISPSQMFAGTYSAYVHYINVYDDNSIQTGVSTPLNLPREESRRVTIIGEKSPYISSTNSPVSVNGTVVLTGVRFGRTRSENKIYVNNDLKGSVATSDGTTLSFPASWVTGAVDPIRGILSSPVQIENLRTGKSNVVFVSVNISSEEPVITSISPNSGGASSTITISGTGLTGVSSVNFRNSAGVLIGSINPNSTSMNTVAFTLGNSLPAGTYQVSVATSNCRGGCDSGSVAFTVTSGTTQPTLQVLSPNGGETINISQPLKVILKTNNSFPAKHYINLVSSKGQSYSLDSLLGSYGLSFTTEQISQPNQSAIFNIPSYYKIDSTDNFKIKICVYNICDESDSNFNIASSTNIAPRITGFAAIPINISVGQSVSFNWNATDANNDDLNWSIDWGNNGGGGGGGSACSQQGRGWVKTTSNSWSQPGTYTVTASVRDCVGATDSHSLVIVVGPSVAAKPVILSVFPTSVTPNGIFTISGSNFTSTNNTTTFSCPGANGSGHPALASAVGNALYTTAPTLEMLGTFPVFPQLNCNVTVSNSNGTSNNVPFTITAPLPPTSLSISTKSVTAGKVGSVYSVGVEGAGGVTTESYQWSIVSGTLPPGTSIIPVRCRFVPCRQLMNIGGTPTTVGTYPITIRLTAGEEVVTKNFNIVVDESTTPNLTLSFVSSSYSLASVEGALNRIIEAFKNLSK